MKLINLFVLIGFVAILIVGLTPYIQAKIVSSGTAVQTSSSPGSGTVTSISQGTGLSFSANPLITTGTINLAEALTGTIGGVKILNCSNGYFMAQTNATGQLSCVGELNNGTITGVTAGTGISGGGTSGTVTINLADANPKQPYFGFSDRIYAWLRPNGTVATVFGGQGWTNFVANGTAATHALAQGYYIKYSNTSAAGLSANGSAGITQTTAQTQLRYLPIIRTSIMRNGSNANMREWFGISDSANIYYYSRAGGMRGAGIFWNTNSSDTQWQCCTNDAGAGGMTCTTTTIDVTANAAYNLTLNLTNYPTDIRCTVQNNTAINTITKTSNIPSNTGSNMFVANVAMSTTAGNNVNYSIRYMYLESQ